MHAAIIYPLLKKFLQNGWVEQSPMPGERGQTRKQYRITPAGRKYLIEQLSIFSEQDASNDGAFLFRVAFFDAFPRQKRLDILEARRRYLNLRRIDFAELSVDPHGKSFGTVAVDRHRARIQDELRWTRKLEQQIESDKGDITSPPAPTRRDTRRRS